MNTFLQNKWNLGICDDVFVWDDWDFQYSKNIDIRRNIKWIKLSSKNTHLFQTDWLISCFLSTFVFTDKGKIYNQAWTLVYTLGTYPDKILNAVRYKDYYYWITTNYIARVEVSNTESGTWTNVDEDYINIIPTSAAYFLNIYDEYLLIWMRDIVYKLDDQWNMEQVVWVEGNIKGMFFSWANIVIYTDIGKKYFWDWESSNFISVILNDKQYYRSCINDGDMDYMISWISSNPLTSALHWSSWYSNWIVKKALDRNNLFNFTGKYTIWEINCMWKQNNMIYIPSQQWIYGYWTFYPWLNPVINLDYWIDNDYIWAMKSDSSSITFSYEKDGIYYLDKINTTQNPSLYMDSWELILRAYNWWVQYKNKIINSINLAFEKLNQWEKIEVYLRKNWNASWWNPVVNIDYSNIYDQEIFFKNFSWPWVDIGKWNYIEAKIVLYSWTSNLTSPILYELWIDWEEID